MIFIEQKHLEIVKQILDKYPYKFFAFGSRVKGNCRKLSDLDLCFEANIPSNVKFIIEEEFEESNLPYKVDLVDLNLCDKNFRDMIIKDRVQIK